MPRTYGSGTYGSEEYGETPAPVLGSPGGPFAMGPYGTKPYAGTIDDLTAPVSGVSEAVSYIYENVTVSLTISAATHYVYENVTTAPPTPFIWYIFPTSANPGQSVTVIGTGFGSAQSSLSGQILFDNQNPLPFLWEEVPASPNAYTPNSQITPNSGTIDPEHNQVGFVVPEGAFSGPVKISTVT